MVVLAVSASSGSTRSDGGHSARGSGGRRWPLLHTTNLWRWLALRTVMLKMLGFARRSNELSARPAHRGHRHHNATVLHLAEKTLTTFGPLYNQFGQREAADSNTNILNFFLIG